MRLILVMLSAALRSSAEILAGAANPYHAARTRRVSAAGLAPTSGEVVTQFQSDSARTDSPVRILTCPARQSVSIASQRTVAQKPRGTAWFRGGKEDFKKAWISIEWMNGCLNNSTKDAARALPDTTFGCGNPPSTTAVLPRADLGFTCRRKSLGTDQALRSSDQDVAAQREHAAGSDGCAVDRGDDRLFAFHDGVEALSDEPVVPWIGSSRTARANWRSASLPR